MTQRTSATRFLLLCLIVFAMVPLDGQSRQRGPSATAADLANARPGRDPNQPIDEEYTKGIKKYTTETFFNSPLTDYMPASKTVPTPKAILGDIAGAEGKLPYSKEVYDYMRLLAKSTPRVKVFTIGTTEEGREMIAVAVASEALMAKLDAEQGGPRQARRPAHHQVRRCARRRDRAARGAGLLPHRHHPFDRSGLADGADGAGLPAGGGREPLRPQHPRARHHADHARRRSRRPRPDRGRLRVAEEAPQRDADEQRLLGALRRSTTTTATRWR